MSLDLDLNYSRELMAARHEGWDAALKWKDYEPPMADWDGIRNAARNKRFPLPKKRRWRTVIAFPHGYGEPEVEFRTDESQHLWGRNVAHKDDTLPRPWHENAKWLVTPHRVALWADLYANPTEEVPE